MSNLPFPISQKLLKFCERIREKINTEDTQLLGLIVGKVGCGKSVRAQEIAFIVNQGLLEMSKVAFNKEQFIKAVLNSRKETIIGDEGISLFFSRGAMTKEGRLMAELITQMRQRNLLVLLCIPDPLNVDGIFLEMTNFVIDCWESRKPINGKPTTIKGNMRLWPKFQNHDYVAEYLQYKRFKKAQPLKWIQPPSPYLMEAGSAYGEGHKPAFYAVPREAYLKEKESILDKYRKMAERKKPNRSIDYAVMDKLIKARVPHSKIAGILDCSLKAVRNRASGKHQEGILRRNARE